MPNFVAIKHKLGFFSSQKSTMATALAATTTTTTTTDGRLADIPKNRTGRSVSRMSRKRTTPCFSGLFAGETLQEVKPRRNQLNSMSTLSPRHRQLSTSNLISASLHSRSVHRKSDGTIASENSTRSTSESVRNAFPPSPIRRQKSRMASVNASKENLSQDSRDLSSKQSFYTSPASARLRSEIEHIQSKLKLHGELNKMLAAQQKQVEHLHSFSWIDQACILSDSHVESYGLEELFASH
jgi:hypothetical protein